MPRRSRDSRRSGATENSTRGWPVAAWIGLGLLLLGSFAIDLNNVATGGSIDLRNRVTGVRLLLHGIDPYHYKWSRPEPEIYADPYNNPHLPVSKTTATPALLLAGAPLAPLPYRVGQFLWLGVQGLLLLGLGAAWWHGLLPGRRGFFALFLLGWTFTAAARLEMERGQAYLLLATLLAVWFTATRVRPAEENGFWLGLLAGLLVALRPPFLLLLPFLALHRRGQLLGAGAGLLLGFGLPLLLLPGCWSDYATAMQTHAQVYLAGSEPRPGPQPFPSTIEGMPTDMLAGFAVIPYADFSIHRLLRAVGIGPLPVWALLVVPALGFTAWLIATRRRAVPNLLPGLAAWLFLADLFLPAYRNSYNDVLLLNLVALAWLAPSLPRAALTCAYLALPVGWAVAFFQPETPWLILLPSTLFTLAAILLVPPRSVPGNELGPNRLASRTGSI